jgi:hypothetical protein
MKIQLFYRSYGIHKPIKEAINIPCRFEDVYLGEDRINEQLLIDNIPEGYLQSAQSRVLLVVDDGLNSVGQCGLEKFLNWKKYFDSYVLHLSKEENNGDNGN